jgi:HPt (histidine-containing phosphotransfer) domain-containing protein
MTEPSPQPSINEALDRLWKQFLPQIEERVAALESAGTALAAGRLSHDQREAAHAAAHKLAGVLGTFGLTRGTILAREAELLYSGETDPEAALQLSEIARRLKELVADRA